MRLVTTAAALALLLAAPAAATTTTTYFQDCADRTGENATVVLPQSSMPLVGGDPLEPGAEIAVFTPEGLCAGAAAWNGQSLAIAVWGTNSATNDVDGFLAGEALAFRAYHQGTLYGTDDGSVEISFHTDYDSGPYAPDAIFVIDSMHFGVSAEPGAGDDFEFELEAPFPNPFAATATLRYSLPAKADVQLAVFDVLGRRVAMMVDETRPAGRHEITFEAAGSLAAGLYIVRLQAGRDAAVRRMTLVR